MVGSILPAIIVQNVSCGIFYLISNILKPMYPAGSTKIPDVFNEDYFFQLNERIAGNAVCKPAGTGYRTIFHKEYRCKPF